MPDSSERGFIWNDRLYPFHVTDRGKDLLLIDSIAQLPAAQFFDMIEDDFEVARSPVLLALMATSIRNKHPEWSHQRVERTVLNLSLSEDVEFVGGDEEEGEDSPPDEADDSSATASGSPSSESSPSPTPAESLTPAT